jgi:hypothetical protein
MDLQHEIYCTHLMTFYEDDMKVSPKLAKNSLGSLPRGQHIYCRTSQSGGRDICINNTEYLCGNFL